MGQIILLTLVVLPILSAAAVIPLRQHSESWRDRMIRGTLLLEALAAVSLLIWRDAQLVLPGVCGLGLRLNAGSLQSLLVLLTAFLWGMTGLTCPSYFAAADKRSRFYMYWLLTLGALMGVFLASDLFTLFVFFEIMSFTSYVWVVQNETEEALRAGETYLAIAVIGGMTLLAGMLLMNRLLGTLEFSQWPALAAQLSEESRGALYLAGGCCLVGFGAKAGMFPLHIWLPKAHPVAPAPASALLSGILTKSGVFGILILSRYLFRADIPWNRIILILGVITMVLGAVLALLSIDLKRTLACSSMSQIGFILVGVAMQGYLNGENALAAWGTVLHMLNHAVIKLVLFTSAGIIYLGTHSLNLNEIRGWGRNKPWLKGVFFVGAASIAGVPGFSGYISKTLLHESIVEYLEVLTHAGASTGAFEAVEWLFLISGGLTAAYMTKLFIAIFASPRAEKQKPFMQDYMTGGTKTAITLGALILVVPGAMPALTMEKLAIWGGAFLKADSLGHALHYFSWENLKGALISLVIGAAIYLLLVRPMTMRGRAGTAVYLDRWPKGLDLEAFYRLFLRGISFAATACARALASVGDLFVSMGKAILFTNAPNIFVPKHDENFGAYEKKPSHLLPREAFSIDLLLAALGAGFLLLYMLISA